MGFSSFLTLTSRVAVLVGFALSAAVIPAQAMQGAGSGSGSGAGAGAGAENNAQEAEINGDGINGDRINGIGAGPGKSICVPIAPADVLNVAICPPETVQDDLIRSARVICAARAECLVWFWDDAQRAPAAVPGNSSDLTPAQVGAALGVWVHHLEQFVSIDRSPAGQSDKP